MSIKLNWCRGRKLGARGVLVTTSVCCVVLSSSAGIAQTTPPVMPPVANPPILEQSDPNKPLTQKLKEGEGVLKPNSNMDREILVTPPPSVSNMPVIPPPSETGGEKGAQPK